MNEELRQKAVPVKEAVVGSQDSGVPFTPFVILTPDLIIVPTPIAVSVPAYRVLYQRLHATPAFCEMGFGPHFPAREWTDAETREMIQNRDVDLSWKERGMGDFAVGLWPKPNQESILKSDSGRLLGGGGQIRILEGDDYDKLIAADDEVIRGVEWVGYAGARDAIITSLRDVVSEDTQLPSWQEMIEVRYGVAPEYWGKGVARGAAEAVMQWAASERGVKRFIAETEKTNIRSRKILEKLGFRLSGTDYWKEPSEFEWERVMS